MTAVSVFMKKKQSCGFNYAEILKTIPENSYSVPQPDKQNKVETRWRFLNIPSTKNNKFVTEISKKTENTERLYLNKYKKWVPYFVDPIFDQYVVKQYFYYSDQ